jgi:hypothetical protein
MMGWMAPLRHLGARVLVGENQPADREPSMNEITTVGLDFSKNVFQVHAVRCGSAGKCGAEAVFTEQVFCAALPRVAHSARASVSLRVRSELAVELGQQ